MQIVLEYLGEKWDIWLFGNGGKIWVRVRIFESLSC